MSDNLKNLESGLKQNLLLEILQYFIDNNGNFLDSDVFLLKHRKNISLIEEMKKDGFIWYDSNSNRDTVKLRVAGLFHINEGISKTIRERINLIILELQKNLDEDHSLLKKDISVADIAERLKQKTYDIEVAFYFLRDSEHIGFNFTGGSAGKTDSQLTSTFKLNSGIFSYNSIEEAMKELTAKSKKTLKTDQVTASNQNDKFLRTAFASYELIEIIGQGGNGKVHSAKVEGTQSLVAIKILDASKASSEKLKRFKNEYIFSSRNKHPNIITVTDHGLTKEQSPFFVMPLYKQSLRKVIRNVSSDEAFRLFNLILDGVDAAHKQNAIHRDLKPENILVSEDKLDVVIADFGIAEFSGEDIFTEVETKIDTRLANFQYAAPEQRIPGKNVDKTADIYALGLILNELFTNEIPYGTNYKNIKTVSSDYSYLDRVVEKMLQQSPSERYKDIEDIKKELIVLGANHVSLQKISALRNMVIPDSEADDPLILDPIKVVGGSWDKRVLTIKLSQQVNDKWIYAIRNMGNYSCLKGKGPDDFRLNGANAIISADDEIEAQKIIDHFKAWLPMANKIYEKNIKAEQQEKRAKEIEDVKNRLKAEELKANVNNKLRF